ncbi:30S ribosomal protein S7, partial [Candidatus Aminicenantes bacterium AC-708-I09]|nr:30S ribosomal protein S7 [Candidatus Aminicenantes bacterium AC-708-I09]
MPRRGKVKKRKIPPDPIHNSTLIAKLINVVMKDGKKSKAQKIVYGALEEIRKKTKQDPLKQFEKAVENVRPLLETK